MSLYGCINVPFSYFRTFFSFFICDLALFSCNPPVPCPALSEPFDDMLQQPNLSTSTGAGIARSAQGSGWRRGDMFHACPLYHYVHIHMHDTVCAICTPDTAHTPYVRLGKCPSDNDASNRRWILQIKSACSPS